MLNIAIKCTKVVNGKRLPATPPPQLHPRYPTPATPPPHPTTATPPPLPYPRSTLRASFVASQFVGPGAGRTTFNSTPTPLYTHLIWHYTIIKFKRLYQPIFSDNRGKLCRVIFLGEQSLSLPIDSANQTSSERFTARDKITWSQLELHLAPSDG